MPNHAVRLDWNREDHTAGQNRRPEGQPARKLNRDVIVQAAFRVADANGLDAVTIRRVAAELDSPPASLYAHIAAKTDLLALMADQLTAKMLVEQPLPSGWREALGELARQMHGVLTVHPWATQVFARRPGIGPNAIRRAKQLARAVTGLGLEPDQVWELLAIIDDYTIGNALRVTPGVGNSGPANALTANDLVEFPELAALPTAGLGPAHLDRFERGLQTVLDGIELRFVKGKRRK